MFIKLRRRNTHFYNRLLRRISGITLPLERPYVENVYWMYGILIEKEFGITKNRVREYLKQRGIETRDFFFSLHRQPFFWKLGIINKKDRFPVADEISQKGFYLPSGSGLKLKDISYIVRQIKNIKKVNEQGFRKNKD